jgi:hypothetical protein
MSYQRVIPRDLFNEGNLLKCYGKLWLLLEPFRQVRFDDDGQPFEIDQDVDGNLTVMNVQLFINERLAHLYRPLNSRQPWPLYVSRWNMDPLPVFTDEGDLSPEMLKLLHN